MSTDRFSGPGRQVVQICEHFDGSDFEFALGSTLLEGYESTEFIREVSARGIPVHVLRQKKPYDPAPIRAVCRLVREQGICLIQTHGYKTGVIGWVVRRLTGVPWVAFLHGHTAENRKMSWYYRLELALAKRADRIVTVSEEMRTRLVRQGLPAERTRVIHNAVDPEQFQTGARMLSRADFGIAPEEKLIGVIGRFSPEKGQDVFLEAFRSVVSTLDSVKALLVGEGPTEGSLREYCDRHGLAGSVVFAGYQQDMAEVYPLLDLVVLPSRSEGLPNVAMEALSFNVPVVATAVGGTPEVIRDGISGMLVPPDAPDRMAEAIVRMFVEPSLAERVRTAGAKLIRDEYSPSVRIRRVEELYAGLLAGRES